MKKSIGRFMAVCVLFLLLTSPSVCAAGAARGLALWGSAAVPSLLPFMICVGAVVGFQAADLLIHPCAPLFRLLFGLSPRGSFVMLCGLLCGYPMGAKLDGEFLENGQITPSEGRYLLAVCNHPSPMFLLGYTAGRLHAAGVALFSPLLLAAVYLPALPLSLLARICYGGRFGGKRAGQMEARNDGPDKSPAPSPRPFSFDDHMMSSFETMIRIGGYIMIFSIAAAFLEQMGLPGILKAPLIAVLEMTTGIQELCASLPPSLCLPAVAGAVSFGGVSGVFQTKSVLKNPELSIRDYVWWKCLHGAMSALLMAAFCIYF